MKFKTALFILLLSNTLTVFANSEVTKVSSMTVVGIVQTSLQRMLQVTLSPFETTLASTIHREQLQAIRTDALNFLAGDAMTENLKVTLLELQKNDDLVGRPPEELSAYIVTALK